MNRAHLSWTALAFVAGVACDAWGIALPALGIAIALAASARAVSVVVRANIMAALAGGLLFAGAFAHPLPRASDDHAHRFAATVVDARALDGAYETVVRLRDGTLATFASRDAWPVGTRLTLVARRAVFDQARNPGELGARELHAERGIAWQLVHARVLARAPPDPHDATLWLARIRAAASARLHATLGEPDATLLAGAMWGERGTLPPDLRAEFQDTGTVHVLVTAGLHLGVVAGVALAGLRSARLGRVGASLTTIVIVWAYAALSGAHLPSLRAATMLSFALLAHASGRETYAWNALGAAAIVVTLLRPASVTTLSFALSFACVAAIFAFAPPIARACERFHTPTWLAEALGITLATQLGTWPLTAAAFLVIAPYAPLANLVVVPVVGVAMLVGFALLGASWLASVVPFAPFGWLALACANVETSLCDWIVAAVRAASALPNAHVIATPPPAWTIVVYAIACVFAALAFARDRARAGIVAIVAASALCLWPPRPASHDLVVTAIDVGQADALLVRTPRGHAILIDAGGRLERGTSASTSSAAAIGERVVVPVLVRAGVHHLDAVLLSHPHGDHAGGLGPVLRTLGADVFADSGQSYGGHAYRDALDVVRARGIRTRVPRGGDVWQTDDGVTLRFYGPALPLLRGTRSDINSNSLIFRLEYGRFRMLFVGDAGAETEARLLASGVDLRADVLKVGHHGSAYGSTPAFLDAVAPRIALISVGAHNLFGHPAPQTIDALSTRGIAIYRTDRDGAIEVRTDGNGVEAVPFLRTVGSSSERIVRRGAQVR